MYDILIFASDHQDHHIFRYFRGNEDLKFKEPAWSSTADANGLKLLPSDIGLRNHFGSSGSKSRCFGSLLFPF